jgi:spore coat polysaccharide biosynthesis protein SpsF
MTPLPQDQLRMKNKSSKSTSSGLVMAFLQARMGSSRLPGKVLLPIAGKTILERAIERLQASNVIDEVIVLTTQQPADDAVEREARRIGVRAFRGAEFDVLDRYQKASEEFSPEIIIRATSDNPLIDIGSAARIVDALRSMQLDYCMENDLPHGAAVEAITADALRKSHREAVDPRHREHVTLHAKEMPDAFRLHFLTCPPPLRFPHLRVTVDTPEDYDFMRRLITGLPEGAIPAPLEQYIPLGLKIMNINRM